MQNHESDYWKICAALDNAVRIELLELLAKSKSEYPCVVEIAEKLRLCGGTASLYLKQLREAELISSANAERRVYYRASPTTERGKKTISALKTFFVTRPSPTRLAEFFKVIRALAHRRRLSYLRYLDKNPNTRLGDAARDLGIPSATLDRMFDQLNHAHLIDVRGCVTRPAREPENTFLALALA